MSTNGLLDPTELPLEGLQLIEASAGTGKTFNLAGLYLRLIVEAGASVREILVMTFTKAATQELRDRIRRRLVDAARIAADASFYDSDNPEHRFARDVIAASDAPVTELARRLADAAAAVDEATIVTIHGFAQRAAADNAFESALAFDRGEQVDDDTVRRAACADYWRRHVFARDAAGELQTLWPTPKVLYEDLRPLLTRAQATLDGINPGALKKQLVALEKKWEGTPDSLIAALDAAVAADAIKNSGMKDLLAESASPAALVDKLDARLAHSFSTGEAPVLADALAELADTGQFVSKGSNAKKACAEAFENIDALEALAALVPLARLTLISNAATAVSALAAERKIAWRQFSYDDLIVALHAALIHPERGDRLAAALHAQWPFALVDEFQDTDPLQYASLKRVYLDTHAVDTATKPGALLLIGDPKQAIYGFRGGDIYAYLAAARAAGDHRYTLGTNYRSTAHVLEAIEALYRSPDDRPFLEDTIDFPHITAGRTAGDRRLMRPDEDKEDAQTEHPALTVWQLTGGSGTKGDDRPLLVRQTVATIADLLAGDTQWRCADGKTRAVAARDIAVLVNTGWEAAQVQVALAERGIMAVCQRRDSVFASEQATDLVRMLRAIAHPDDITRVRTAETTQLAGRRLRDLITLADDDNAMQSCIAGYQNRHEQWRRRGVLAALESVFIDAAPRVLALTDGERRMSNYLQLGELLATAEPECYGMNGLVHWLEDQIATTADDNKSEVTDDSQLRLESDAELVRIATVHASKGLQYPIVFMPFALWLGAPTKARQPDKPPLIYHDLESTHPEQVRIDLLGQSDAAKTRAVTEAQSEALRLLYVGATRAEQALYLSWREPGDGSSKKAPGAGGKNGALDNLLGRDGASVADTLTALASEHDGTLTVETINADAPPETVARVAPQATAQLGEGRSNLPRPRPAWSSWSFSRLAHAPSGGGAIDAPVPGAEDEWITPDGSRPDKAADPVPVLERDLAGVRFGSAVHDILEKQVGRNWPAPGAALDADRRTLIADTLRRYGLIGTADDDRRIDQTAALVARTLHSPLPEIGSLAQIDRSQLRAEMGFMLRLRGERLQAVINTARAAGYLPAALAVPPQQTLLGLLHGFIDLVVEVNGRYIILDYKTNRLGDTYADYRGSQLSRAMGQSHYDLQYLLYSVALHRHLRSCLGTAYDPATHLGGIQYLFVRAMNDKSDSGVFRDTPAVELIQALDALFDSEANAA